MSEAMVADAAISNEGITPNAKRLLFAGFFAILTAGVGFAIRGGILADWARDYGFSATQNGEIGGAGLTGFCFGIIIGGLVADAIGYGWLVVAAFGLHAVSAILSLAVPTGASNGTAYNFLYWGSFIFAIANGTLEAVANPLVATLFPHNRTHYLNVLHASWPAGLILGGFFGWLMGDKMHIGWKGQLSLFLISTVIYGLLFVGQRMPKSEAAEKGLSFGEMFKDVGILGGIVVCFLLSLFMHGALKIPTGAAYAISGVLLVVVAVVTRFSIGAWLLFALFVVHALVGSVELGTDGWMQNITGNLFSTEAGKWLFIYASGLMFLLRFCAHFIEKKVGLSPVGILLVCATLACIGLNLISMASTLAIAFIAVGVYALGKTFFWPTMLAVASDRFPRTGAIAISIMGGIGMMSAGMLGGPGLGYGLDRFGVENLRAKQPIVHAAYQGDQTSKFLGFEEVKPLDGKKVAAASDAVQKGNATPDQTAVVEATRAGDRQTLRFDSFIPATMAVIYLLLFIYFKAIGGYKTIHIAGTHGAAA
jgi:MFS family permease